MTTSDLPLDGGEASLPQRWWRKKRRGWTAGYVESLTSDAAPDSGLTIAIEGCGKTAFRSFGVGLACSAVMMTLPDELVPDELWALVAPCCRSRRRSL